MATPRISLLRLTRHAGTTATTPAPALSWTVDGADEGWAQAWAEVEAGGDAVRLEGGASHAVDWPFPPLAPREARKLRVRCGGSDGSTTGWSDEIAVCAGFLADGEWVAKFIALAEPARVSQPVWLRHEFMLAEAPVAAFLYVTALGAHETTLNGAPVSDHVLAPGWTPYDKRLVFEAHEVTASLRAGANTVAAAVAGAWRTEAYGFFGRPRRVYGEQPSFAAQLHLRFGDGSERVIATGPEWLARGDLEIVDSGIYRGETVDLRRSLPGWDLPGAAIDGWAPVRVEDVDLVPEPKLAPPVRCTEELPVRDVLTTPLGGTVLDFGQNLVGRLRLTVDLPVGTTLTMRHAEVLEDGELGVRPLREAVQTDTFTLAGGPVVLEPRFTFHGFRYAEISGWPGEVDPAAVTARVLHSDLRPTATFECSDPLVNRLHENVVWGMRGNFLSVPTDCPQRDERLGWTGDLQVFSPTAATLFECSGFLADWLRDLAVEQAAHGGLVPFVIPDALADEVKPTAAWGDAATLVPWALWERYGDPTILADQFDSMRTWADRLLEQAGDDLLWEGSMQFGDWLDPTSPPDAPGESKVSRDVVASAYVARSCRAVAEAAEVLGRHAEAAHYSQRADAVGAAFRAAYVTPAGRMMSDAPTAYALAIGFDLVTEPTVRQALGDRLAERVRAAGYRIATGFVGTPLILGALTGTGHAEAAGRLLLQTQCPSWLYPVTMGATTIWERWDSMLPDGSINPGEMTSFNHYAFGSVADWLHRSLVGLSPLTPGGSELLVQPTPVPGVEWARAEHDTPHGFASVHWRREGESLVVDVLVPPNSAAQVRLPGLDSVEVGSGAHHFESQYPRFREAAGSLSVRSTLADLVDRPAAVAAIREELTEFSAGYADGFFARTAWTEGSRLSDVLFGVPPHVRARLDERLSAL